MRDIVGMLTFLGERPGEANNVHLDDVLDRAQGQISRHFKDMDHLRI